MTDATDFGPFNSVPTTEVHLRAAPLVRVLSQVRWDELTEFNDGFSEKAARFARLLESEYPIAAQETEVRFDVTPNGVSQHAGATIHRFSSPDESWRVYFSPTYLTLETSAYRSRKDFLERLRAVLESLELVAKIPRFIRLGFRYVNRVHDADDYAMLPTLVKPQMLAGRDIPGLDEVQIAHTLSETLFIGKTHNLLAKWAILPPNGSMDPTIEGVETESWVLDLDTYSESKEAFSAGSVVTKARELADGGHAFFRWAVTNEFIRQFGGEQP